MVAKSISLGGGTSCRKSSRRIVFTVVRKGDLRILTLGDRGRGESVANVRSGEGTARYATPLHKEPCERIPPTADDRPKEYT